MLSHLRVRLFTLALLQASGSLAAPNSKPTTKADSVAVQPRSRLLPAAAAAVPGLVIHGAGHFALGQPRTARNLLLMEGVGLGAFLAGGLTLAFTGASRYFVAPAATAT